MFSIDTKFMDRLVNKRIPLVFVEKHKNRSCSVKVRTILKEKEAIIRSETFKDANTYRRLLKKTRNE